MLMNLEKILWQTLKHNKLKRGLRMGDCFFLNPIKKEKIRFE